MCDKLLAHWMARRRAVGGWRGRSLSFKHDGWNYTERKPAYCGPADRNKKYLSVPGIRSTWLNSHKKVEVKVAQRLRRSRAQPRRHRPAHPPCAFLPSSSPMRSSFQVQQNSINLIHPPMQGSGREQPPSAWRISGVFEQRRRRSQPGGRVAFLRLPAARFLRRFIQDRLRPMRRRNCGEEEQGQPISGEGEGPR